MAKPRKQPSQNAPAKPAKEDGRITFVRLGEPRLAAVVKRIAILKNIARYPHSERQAEKVMQVVNEAVTDLSLSFAAKADRTVAVDLSDN